MNKNEINKLDNVSLINLFCRTLSKGWVVYSEEERQEVVSLIINKFGRDNIVDFVLRKNN